MRFISGVILSIFSVTLILIQGCFMTWNTDYPEALFYIATLVSVICAVLMFITENKKK